MPGPCSYVCCCADYWQDWTCSFNRSSSRDCLLPQNIPQQQQLGNTNLQRALIILRVTIFLLLSLPTTLPTLCTARPHRMNPFKGTNDNSCSTKSTNFNPSPRSFSNSIRSINSNNSNFLDEIPVRLAWKNYSLRILQQGIIGLSLPEAARQRAK